ncbi:MAG: winged helix-turn-helix domain-containing protein [Acidobacteriota bacterium]|nr:winged helix-turn-helix domain-containing protein [Acidobacteriota bacterium]
MKSQPQPGTVIQFGPYSFDRALGKLSKHGTQIRLRGMPLKILQHLVERPGEAVSRGELQSLLWNGTAFGDFEHGLNSAVNVVRRTLGDSAGEARYIETVPTQGYRFIAALRSEVALPEAHPSIATIDAGSTVADANQGVESACEIREDAPPGRKPTAPKSLRWWIASALATASLGGGAWWTFQSRPHALIDGSTPSTSHEANDQYNLAYTFIGFQNDIPLARKTFERALELDPHFASARLQLALAIVIEIFNGYTNDGTSIYRAEEELHRAEQVLPGSDNLLLSTQSAVYLAQGRLDRIPAAKLEESWRKGGNPTWLVILRMLEGHTQEPLAILRARNQRQPLNNPTRMFIGETLRTQGDTAGAIHALERALQQAPGNVTAAWFLTMARLDEGKPELARALLEGMRPGFEKNYMWRHAWAVLLAAEGKRNDALQAMDEGTLKFARLTWAVTATTADFYALNGDSSRAIEWLQLAIARGDERVSYFRRNPRLAGLRNDTRFQSLLKAVEARGK